METKTFQAALNTEDCCAIRLEIEFSKPVEKLECRIGWVARQLCVVIKLLCLIDSKESVIVVVPRSFLPLLQRMVGKLIENHYGKVGVSQVPVHLDSVVMQGALIFSVYCQLKEEGYFPGDGGLIKGPLPNEYRVEIRPAVSIQITVNSLQGATFKISVGHKRIHPIDLKKIMSNKDLRYNPVCVAVVPKMTQGLLVEIASTSAEVDLEFKLDGNPFDLSLREYWLDRYGIHLPESFPIGQVFFPYQRSSMTYPATCLLEYKPVTLRANHSRQSSRDVHFEEIHEFLKSLQSVGQPVIADYKELHPEQLRNFPVDLSKKEKATYNGKCTLRRAKVVLPSFKRNPVARRPSKTESLLDKVRSLSTQFAPAHVSEPSRQAINSSRKTKKVGKGKRKKKTKKSTGKKKAKRQRR